MDSNVIFPELPTYTGQVSWAGLLSLAITVMLPVIAALFMRTHWSAFAKGFVLLCCAAVKTFLEAWLLAADTHTHFDLGKASYTVVVQFALAVIAYFGIIRGTAVQQAAIRGGIVRSGVGDGR